MRRETGTEGVWSQSKGGGGETAKVEEGCVVWGGGGGGVYLSILCGGERERIKKIIMYLMVFIKIRIEARQLSVQFAT